MASTNDWNEFQDRDFKRHYLDAYEIARGRFLEPEPEAIAEKDREPEATDDEEIVTKVL